MQIAPPVAREQPAVARKLTQQLRVPLVHDRLRRARNRLIGLHLIAQQHQHVAVNERHEPLHDHPRRDGKAAGALHAGKRERDDRNKVHIHIVQRLAQHPDIVRGAAAAAGLELDERDLMYVVVPALERVELLADGADGGVAHVVVDIFQPHVDDLPALIVQNVQLVAVHPENAAEQVHVHRENVRRQNGVRRLHLRGEVRVLKNFPVRLLHLG